MQLINKGERQHILLNSKNERVVLSPLGMIDLTEEQFELVKGWGDLQINIEATNLSNENEELKQRIAELEGKASKQLKVSKEK